VEFVKRLAFVGTLALLAGLSLTAQSNSRKQAPKAQPKGAASAPPRTPPKTPAKAAAKAPAKAVARAAPVKPASKAQSARKKTTAANKGKTAKAPPRHYAQMQPAPERYMEIQQALADKGYFHGPVDGAWGADSTDAMKRFQTEQNLDADGKISALSLIALGLGPRRGSSSKAVTDDTGKPSAVAAEAPETSATVVPESGGGANSKPGPEGAATTPADTAQPQR